MSSSRLIGSDCMKWPSVGGVVTGVRYHITPSTSRFCGQAVTGREGTARATFARQGNQLLGERGSSFTSAGWQSGDSFG